ncbi:MAG: hypothetical protein AB1515_03885 [Nitrospirota bacterium]
MYRRSTIPDEAHLTAFQILELTTQQYIKKRKHSPAAVPFAPTNGHGKLKAAKSGRRSRPSKAARARSKKS